MGERETAGGGRQTVFPSVLTGGAKAHWSVTAHEGERVGCNAGLNSFGGPAGLSHGGEERRGKG